ncbi:MAG: polysaccharide deacetylase family protein [Xanthomonadales bacterium]|nr:polysaccharide deacetylase family protein [Xanthomonadales bacterium]
MSCPIFTYHSQNIRSNRYGENDHVSLKADLEDLHTHGKRLISLTTLVDWLLAGVDDGSLDDAVCITFDDGCKLEISDEIVPGYGLQTSFLSILKDFREQQSVDTPHQVRATTFVLADAAVREQMDRESLFGLGWMQADWWAAVKAEGIIDVQSHGWDHLHNMQPDVLGEKLPHARFVSVDSFAQCELQVFRAGQVIASGTDGVKPQYFAYPYGAASVYMRDTYLPENINRTGIRAAFSTQPAHVTLATSRWNIPRYVCGRDWQTPQQFAAILDGSFAASRPKS